VTFAPSSRVKLNLHQLARFPGEGLFDRVARAVCRAECLPRKELYEAWELARRTRRRFRGGRVVDLACGHALLAHLMLLLDDTSKTALAVDARVPKSAAKVARVLCEEWPRLAGRVTTTTGDVNDVALGPGDVVVSCHACGELTDRVLARAIEARARVAVLPCCHDEGRCDLGGLRGWMDPSLAIDATRAARLRAAGYRVHTQLVPAEITPKNRLLLGEP
jgi:Methyltransferase domain